MTQIEVLEKVIGILVTVVNKSVSVNRLKIGQFLPNVVTQSCASSCVWCCMKVLLWLQPTLGSSQKETAVLVNPDLINVELKPLPEYGKENAIKRRTRRARSITARFRPFFNTPVKVIG